MMKLMAREYFKKWMATALKECGKTIASLDYTNTDADVNCMFL
jgi:hypothetical protein